MLSKLIWSMLNVTYVTDTLFFFFMKNKNINVAQNWVELRFYLFTDASIVWSSILHFGSIVFYDSVYLLMLIHFQTSSTIALRIHEQRVNVNKTKTLQQAKTIRVLLSAHIYVTHPLKNPKIGNEIQPGFSCTHLILGSKKSSIDRYLGVISQKV